MDKAKAVRKPTNLEEDVVARKIWCVTPEVAVTVKDMLNPKYWAHVARMLRAGERIEAVPADRHYFAEFFVLGASDNWAQVILLRETVLIKDNKQTTSGGYTVGWNATDKWRVTQDGNVLTTGHDDKKAAEKWLKEHKETVR